MFRGTVRAGNSDRGAGEVESGDVPAIRIFLSGIKAEGRKAGSIGTDITIRKRGRGNGGRERDRNGNVKARNRIYRDSRVTGLRLVYRDARGTEGNDARSGVAGLVVIGDGERRYLVHGAPA